MFKFIEKNQIYKDVLLLAVPMMIQNGITNAVYLIDNLMVGSLGTESMTAVSIVAQLMFVYYLALFGGVSGPGIYCAQYFGQQNKEGFWNVFRLKLWIGLFISFVFLLIYYIFAKDLINLYLLGADAGINKTETLNLSLGYFKIMLWSLLPFTLTIVYSTSLRETGDSIKPMVVGIICVLVDIVFNYFLIFGKCGFPRLGVEGASIATVLSKFVEMFVMIIWVYSAKNKVTYITEALKEFRIPIKNMLGIINKSIPIFFNEFLWAAGFATTIQCYSLKGLDVVAGLNIASTLQNLVIVVIISMGSSVGILIGQLLGASKFEEAKENAIRLARFTATLGLVVALVVISISNLFPSFFDTTEKIRLLGRNFIIVNALFLPLLGILNSLYFTLRSGGKTFITFLFDSGFTWVAVVPTAFVLCKYSNLPILTIFIIVNCLELIKIIIAYILIKKGVWISNLVENKDVE